MSIYCEKQDMRNKKLIILLSILCFVTVLIVMGSVLFSVQQITAYCYNDDDVAVEMAVANTDNNGIKRGRSIFLLNENEVIANVESKVNNIKVINIERKFPNAVYINYVKIFDYLAYELDGKVYYASSELKVLSEGEVRDNYSGYIKLVCTSEQTAVKDGYLFAGSSKARSIMLSIMDAITQLGMHSTMTDLFEFVDIDRYLAGGSIYIKTRTGVYIEVQGNEQGMKEKLHYAMSLYYAQDKNRQQTGTIIAYRKSDGSTKVTYTDKTKY